MGFRSIARRYVLQQAALGPEAEAAARAKIGNSFEALRLGIETSGGTPKPLETLIRDEKNYQEDKAGDSLNQVGKVLKPVVQAGLGAIYGVAGATLLGPVVGAKVGKLAGSALIDVATSNNTTAAPPRQEKAPMFDENGFDLAGLLKVGLDYKLQKDALRASIVPAAFPSLPALGSAGRAIGSALGSALPITITKFGGKIATALGNMSRKRVVAIAKQLGIQGAATALGIGAVEIAQMVIDDGARRGRGKGVSAAALRTTRRTMRTVERMHRQIAGYCRDAGVRTTRVVRVPASGKRCR